MISREEAIFELSLVKAVVLDPDFNSRAVEAIDMAIEALKQPERPKGRWIGMPRMGVHDMCCSNCRYSSGIRFWNSPYCPNCGADMRGEEE
jgi:hypothetical protein